MSQVNDPTPAQRQQEQNVISQENAVFKDALAKGRITQAQYDAAMEIQNKRASDNVVPKETKPTAWTTNYQASQAYWTAAGFPQYGGIYGVPTGIGPNQEIYDVKEIGGTPTTRPPMSNAELTGQKQLAITVGPKIDYVKKENKGSFFGPTALWIDPKTGTATPYGTHKATPEEKADLKRRYLAGENIFGMSPEERATAGLSLATAVIAPIAVASGTSLSWAAAMAAGAITIPATADVVTVAAAGRHITPAEAVGYAAIATLGVQAGRSLVNSPLIKGRVQSMVDASYERQIRFNEAVLQGKVRGETAVWKPEDLGLVGNNKVLYELTGQPMPKVNFASQVNIARVPSGDAAMGMSGFQRVAVADDLFDFGFVPKSAMRVEYVRPPTPTTAIGKPSGLPLYYGIGGGVLTEMEYLDMQRAVKQDLKIAEANEQNRLLKVDQSSGKFPKSTLDVDYNPMGFDNYPLDLAYAEGKTVSAAWAGPYQKGPTANLGMRPFTDLAKSASKGGGTPSAGPIKTVTTTKTPTLDVGTLSNLGSQFTTKTVFQTGFNPSVWQGVPIYGRKGTAMSQEQEYVLDYPESGLPHPPKLGESLILDLDKAQRDRSRVSLGTQGFMLISQRGISTSIIDLGQGVALGRDVGVSADQIARGIQQGALGQGLDLGGIFEQPTPRPVFGIPTNPFVGGGGFGGSFLGGFGGFDLGGGGRRGGRRSGVGRYPRAYPIVTGRQVLENLGLGSTAKTKRKVKHRGKSKGVKRRK